MTVNTNHDDRTLVREALERSTEGAESNLDGLLDAVPRMLREAELRRERAASRDALTASIPLARAAIPRLAAAAALLVVVSVALVLTGSGAQSTATTTSGVDDLIFAGNGVTEELLVESILEPEETP
jgi:hypothetical protein